MRPVSISLSLYISTANIRPNQVSHSHVLAPSTRRIRTFFFTQILVDGALNLSGANLMKLLHV